VQAAARKAGGRPPLPPRTATHPAKLPGEQAPRAAQAPRVKAERSVVPEQELPAAAPAAPTPAEAVPQHETPLPQRVKYLAEPAQQAQREGERRREAAAEGGKGGIMEAFVHGFKTSEEATKSTLEGGWGWGGVGVGGVVGGG
jgi:hypothetical protein